MKKDIMPKGIKRSLPVSSKFYASLMIRIEQSLAAVGADSSVVANVKECVDAYIRTSGEPAESQPASVRLVFALLRTEIDKAMARSAAARKRRKPMAAQKPQCSVREDTMDVGAELVKAADLQPLPNRRERRQMERDQRRRRKQRSFWQQAVNYI